MSTTVRSTNRIRDLLVRLVVLVIGSGFLFMGTYVYNSTQNQIAAMLPTEGRVVDFIARTETSDDGNEEETIYYPVVEFRTFRGDVIRFEGRSGSNPPMHRIGDTVKVRYDPQTPQSALIDSWEAWVVPYALLGFGGFFTMLGAMGFIYTLAAMLK